MHAIGLGHTWGIDHYVGDFSYTPMGYYGRYNGTGKFDQNWVQGTYLDQMEGRLWMEFQDVRDLKPAVPREETIAVENYIQTAFDEARDLYNHMDWLGCYDALDNIEGWIDRLMYTITDDEAPEIVDWGYEGALFYGNLTVWATVIDDLSGVDNVSVHVEYGSEEFVYPAVYSSGNWTTEVDEFPVDIDIEMWVEATDRGLNTAVSESMIWYGDYRPVDPWSNPLVVGSLILGSVAVVIIVVWFLRKRSIGV
jgi:hypothetical protein